MDSLLIHLGEFGAVAVLGFAAIGSALGCGAAAMAAVGAWKRRFMQNKTAPFQLMIFVGAPMTQTFYGFIVMLQLMKTPSTPETFMARLAAGVVGGMAMGASALAQGKAAAAACDAFAETDKGFANDLLVIGIVESIALLVMVLLMLYVK
jgi:V/A-type H+-transporting ATPase subunit K